MNRSFGVVVLCVISLATIAGGCQSEVIDLSVPASLPDSVSFVTDVQPILTTSCGSGACHINQTTSGVNLTTREQAVTSVGTQYGRAIVQPGNAAGSPMVDKIGSRPQFGVRMPAGRPALTQEQVAKIRSWIDDGAKDN